MDDRDPHERLRLLAPLDPEPVQDADDEPRPTAPPTMSLRLCDELAGYLPAH